MPRPFRSRSRRRSVHHAADAQAVQAAEQAAARQRIIALAQYDRRSGWNAPTAAYGPLMTPAQEARGHGGRNG